MRELDILFIWDIAGIASMLARELTARGINASCMMRRLFDKGRISEFYGAFLHEGSASNFIETVRKASKKASVTHFSALDSLNNAPILPLFKAPGRKIIMHYHGSDIRGKGEQKRRHYASADLVLVSTPDLLREVPHSIWLPRPVDTNHFKPLPSAKNEKSSIYVNIVPGWLATAKKFCREKGLSLTVLNRKSGHWIPYSDFPAFLNQFEYFLDFKGQEELSKNALEALACELKVVHANKDGEITFHCKMPETNRLENVVKRYLNILCNALHLTNLY